MDKETLTKMYCDKRRTIVSISKELSQPEWRIRKTMKEYGVQFRPPGHVKGTTHDLETRRKLSECRKGVKFSEEWKKNISESRKGSKNPNFGKKAKIHGIRCWYTMPDGSVVSMRSQWEVWYAEHLRENSRNFLYEPRTFVLHDGSAYTPDFYLPDIGQYVEVKGWLTPQHKDRIQNFKNQYPNEKLILADRNYLTDLGIDLRKKWISTKPKFQCENCSEEYFRSYPQQRLCSVQCRNIIASKRQGPTMTESGPKRSYNGSQSGSKNNGSKLNEDQVRKIRDMRSKGFSYAEIAAETGASHGNIGNIIKGKSWKDLV